MPGSSSEVSRSMKPQLDQRRAPVHGAAQDRRSNRGADPVAWALAACGKPADEPSISTATPERRRAPRRKSTLGLYLHHRGQPIAIGDALDFGRGGLFTVPRPRLDHVFLGMLIDVGVGLERNGVTRRFRLPARVAHFEADGVGLAFTSEDPGLTTVVELAVRTATDSDTQRLQWEQHT